MTGRPVPPEARGDESGLLERRPLALGAGERSFYREPTVQARILVAAVRVGDSAICASTASSTVRGDELWFVEFSHEWT